MRQREWEAANVKLTSVTFDTDTTVHTVYGKQMGARRSYNPKNKGKKSFQPILTFLAETQEFVGGELRNGNRPTGTQIAKHLEYVMTTVPKGVKVIYGRADCGFYCWLRPVKPLVSESVIFEPRRRGKRKFTEGIRVRGREEGAGSFRGRTGTVTSCVPGSGYWVNFDDGRVENVPAHWLEAAGYANVAGKMQTVFKRRRIAREPSSARCGLSDVPSRGRRN